MSIIAVAMEGLPMLRLREATPSENEMGLSSQSPPPKRRSRSGARLHTPSNGGAVNDNFTPKVSFQYLQLFPMTAIFLAMVALLWIVASSY
jgi:hypothetical protein